jgi:hypothetical protein
MLETCELAAVALFVHSEQYKNRSLFDTFKVALVNLFGICSVSTGHCPIRTVAGSIAKAARKHRNNTST